MDENNAAERLNLPREEYEFYAEKLREIADKFQAGIGYDYDAAMEQCEKRKGKKHREEDTGGEAMAMGLLNAQQAAEARPRRPLRRNPRESPPRLRIPQRMDPGQKIFDALRNF